MGIIDLPPTPEAAAELVREMLRAGLIDQATLLRITQESGEQLRAVMGGREGQDQQLKQDLARDLREFIDGDCSRSMEFYERKGLQIPLRMEGSVALRPILKGVLTDWMNERNGQKIDAKTSYRAMLFFCDMLDGFNEFEDPSLIDLRQRLARYWITLIDLWKKDGYNDEQLWNDPLIGRAIAYLVCMKHYDQKTPTQIIECLRQIAQQGRV
ncbi:MAG: hypothetical protein WCT53_00125 [Candidatus Gracilibacteria bacterium]|jgi:hypothetical protein